MGERNLNLDSAGAISLAERMVAADSFKLLFREGMALVEETAAYLDGPGREDSRVAARDVALAYASESMRLTTRLMQMTSWLLLQRAVNEGELTRAEAEREHRKVAIAVQDSAVNARSVNLPETLRDLLERSQRMQDRIVRLDTQLREGSTRSDAPNPVALQIDLLHMALNA